MSKLKKLSQDDLSTISDDFGEILEREVSKNISTKEIEDLAEKVKTPAGKSRRFPRLVCSLPE